MNAGSPLEDKAMVMEKQDNGQTKVVVMVEIDIKGFETFRRQNRQDLVTDWWQREKGIIKSPGVSFHLHCNPIVSMVLFSQFYE